MNIPDISLPKMPWRKDRYIDVNVPEGLKEGDTLTVKQGDNTFGVKIPSGENIETITVDPPDGDFKQTETTDKKKISPSDLKNALEIDPYGVKLVDKLQKYGFFKQEDFQEIAQKMSEEGMKNVLMAYSKLLLKIPQALLQKVQKQMLPQMDGDKPVTDTEFQKYFQELTEQYTGLFGAMNMIWEEEGVKVAREKLLEAIKEEFIKPALKIGTDALDEGGDQLDASIDKVADKIEKMIRNSLNAGFHGVAGAGPIGNAFSIARGGLAAAAAAASGIGLGANSMEALFETIDRTTDKNKQNIKKYAKFLKDRSKQVKDVSNFVENFLQQPFGDVTDKDYSVTKKLPSTTSVKSSATVDAKTSSPPDAKTSSPPDAKTSSPPDAKTSSPPDAKTSAPPDAKTSAPPDAKTSSPPDAKTSSPPDAKPSAPPVENKTSPPSKKGGHRKTKKKHHKKSTHNRTKTKK